MSIYILDIVWSMIGGIRTLDVRYELSKAEVFFSQPVKDIRIITDIKYGTNERNSLDIYLPSSSEQKHFPVIMYVHGGCWETGDKDMYGSIGRYYAGKGIGVVIINYRLSPEVKHPAHIEDTAQAFAWVCNNIASYDGDANRLYLMGHSSGAHLVALLATNEEYLHKYNISKKKIKYVIAISGIYKLNYTLKIAGLDYIFPSEKDKLSGSPLSHVKADDDTPPFVLLYAENDIKTLPQQARSMQWALSKAKCESILRIVPGKDHYSILFETITPDSPTSNLILSYIK